MAVVAINAGEMQIQAVVTVPAIPVPGLVSGTGWPGRAAAGGGVPEATDSGIRPQRHRRGPPEARPGGDYGRR